MTHKASILIAAAMAILLHAATAAAQTDPKATVTALARIIKNHQKSVVDPFVEKTFSKFRKDAEVATGIADAYFYNAKDTAQAFKYINAAIAANAAHVPAYLLAGEIMQHEYYSDTTVALNWYRQGIKAVPADPQCYIKYAKLVSRINYDYAISTLEDMRTAIPSYPTDLEIARLCDDLTSNYIDANVNRQRALEYFTKAAPADMTPHDMSVYCAYLSVTKSWGKMNEVAAYGHAKWKRAADFTRYLFWANAEMKNYKEALAYADTLFYHSDSVKTDLRDYQYCAIAYSGLNQHGKAIEMFEKLMNTNITDEGKRNCVQNIANSYKNMGDYDNALAKYREYLDMCEAAGAIAPTDYIGLANIYNDIATEKNGAEQIEPLKKADEIYGIIESKYADSNYLTLAIYNRIRMNALIDNLQNGGNNIKGCARPHAEKLATLLMGKTERSRAENLRLAYAYDYLAFYHFKTMSNRRRDYPIIRRYCEQAIELNPESTYAPQILNIVNK